MRYLIIGLLALSCASNRSEQVVVKPKLPVIINQEVIPGEVSFVRFLRPQKKSKLLCGKQSFKYYVEENYAWAYIPVSYFNKSKSLSCHFEEQSGSLIKLTINKHTYPAEKLRVDRRKIRPLKKDLIRIQREQKMLNRLYADSAKVPYFNKPFIAPLSSFITSKYGMRRTYNNLHRGQHLGTDFRAKIGVKIPATNRGIIKFAGDLFYTGNTVIIDHGMDIYTVYGHLSKLMVKKGDIVQQGDIVAESGNTGRTSGPHLHWGVKIKGQYVNGFSLVKESQIHFDNAR